MRYRKATNGTRLYPLADHLTLKECAQFKCDIQGKRRAGDSFTGKLTGEYIVATLVDGNRLGCPRKGQWYISGAVPSAYRARATLRTAYPLAKLVVVRKVQVPTEEIIK